MKPATSVAADPPSAAASSDNSAGRRKRRQHRAPSPATAQERATRRAQRRTNRSISPLTGGRSRNTGQKEALRSHTGREREPEGRGGAAVHPDGAEAAALGTNRADAVEEKPINLSAPARRYTLQLPCLKADSSQHFLPQRAPSATSPAAEVRGRRAAEESERGGVSVGCGPGLGLGLWRGGCLQAELIQYHLQKRLKRRRANMQTNTDNMRCEEAAVGESQPVAEATEAGSVTQQDQDQDQAFEDEMERLIDENEDLKVQNTNISLCIIQLCDLKTI